MITWLLAFTLIRLVVMASLPMKYLDVLLSMLLLKLLIGISWKEKWFKKWMRGREIHPSEVHLGGVSI